MDSMADITHKMDKMKIPQTLLAQAAGMFPSQLSLLVNGSKSPTESTLKQLSAGIDTIEKNRHAIECGVIVLNEMTLKTTMFNAMITVLESRESDGMYKGDPKVLAGGLVQQIYKKITKTEE